MRFSVLAVSVILLFSFVSVPTVAESGPPSDIRIEQWLQGPDRQDFRWNVHLSKPQLTYSQRHEIQIGLAFHVRDLLKAGISPHDLHIVVNLAGKDGHLLGQAYGRCELPSHLSSSAECYGAVNVYVRPGTFWISAIGYDSVHHRGNLWRRTLHVPPVQNDPLPESGRSLPEVELQAAPPRKFNFTVGPSSFTLIFRPPEPVNAFDLGQRELFLPVENMRPLQVDVLINFSPGEVALPNPTSQCPDLETPCPSEYLAPNKVGPPAMFAIAHVLSQLHLRSGCVRLSAVDLLRQQWVIIDRKEVKDLNWSDIRGQVEELEGPTRVAQYRRLKGDSQIATRALADQRQTSAKLAQYLAEIESSSCVTEGPPPLHVLVVVSDSFTFANGIRVSALDPKRFPEARVFHVRAAPSGGTAWDQIETILKPLDPVHLSFYSPTQFRIALAHLIADVEQASRNPAANN